MVGSFFFFITRNHRKLGFWIFWSFFSHTYFVGRNLVQVVYENKDATGMYTYRRAMLFLYYAAIVCYIIFGNFIPDRLYAKYSVWLIIVIVSIIPIILNMVIRWIFIIGEVTVYWFKNDMPHRDIYSKLEENDYFILYKISVIFICLNINFFYLNN